MGLSVSNANICEVDEFPSSGYMAVNGIVGLVPKFQKRRDLHNT